MTTYPLPDEESVFIERLNLLFQEHLAHFVNFARQLVNDNTDAHHVVNGSYIRIVSLASKYHLYIATDNYLKAYIFKTIRHEAINFLKFGAKSLNPFIVNRVFPMPTEEELELEKLKEVILQEIDQVLATMLPEEQAVYILHQRKGMKAREIARHLCISANSIHSLIRRVKNKVAHYLLAKNQKKV